MANRQEAAQRGTCSRSLQTRVASARPRVLVRADTYPLTRANGFPPNASSFIPANRVVTRQAYELSTQRSSRASACTDASFAHNCARINACMRPRTHAPTYHLLQGRLFSRARLQARGGQHAALHRHALADAQRQGVHPKVPPRPHHAQGKSAVHARGCEAQTATLPHSRCKSVGVSSILSFVCCTEYRLSHWLRLQLTSSPIL
eukprot:6187765-Pleurochrysis_carterae.AAC.1